jgi:Putative Ig domain
MSPVSLLQPLFKSLRDFSNTAMITRVLMLCALLGLADSVSASPTVHVYVTPTTAILPATLTQQFTAKVTNSGDTSVKWSATQGSISSSGLFTAPKVNSNTTVSVTATSVADPTASATAVVTVTPAVSVSISPTPVTMNASKQQAFQATVTNTDKTRVTWTATEGTISGGGMFTSPNVTKTTTVYVTATSVEDPTKSARATVTVMPPLAVTVTPGTATVTSATKQQFTGSAQNANNPAVTWTTTQGTIDGNGLFTAPSVYQQTWANVTATSVEDPNKQARAKVTIMPPTSAPLSIVTTALPITPSGVALNYPITATGGFSPYSWTLLSGPLPAGITLNSTGVLSGTSTQIGCFPITIKVTDAGKHQNQQSFYFYISGSAKGQVIPLTYFGMHIDYDNTPWPNIAFGAQRFWDSDTAWAQINTAPGVFDWTTTDGRIATALANHVDILFDLARTPVWAQCAGTNKACGTGAGDSVCSFNQPGQGGPGQCFPPADLNIDGTGSNQHYIDWVTALATRYKGEIKYYEIWNEPTAPIMWEGTTAQLVRMSQDARCIIIGTGCSSLSTYTQKAIDTAAKITTPAYVTDTGINVATAMSDFMNAGGGQYVDVISYHGYVQWPMPPETAVTDAAKLQNVLAGANQQQKPLFSSEGGFGAKVTISDPDQESAWIARFELLMQSIGVQRSYWYAWDGATTPFWFESSGTQIGGTTYNEMTNWLVGATLSSPCAAVGTVWQCGYTRPGGYKGLAVWDTSQSCNYGNCTYSTFAIPSGYDYYLDITGVKKQTNGSTVPIGSKPILLENQ